MYQYSGKPNPLASGNIPDDSITCGICFNVLSKPITLNCGHSFCLECIRDSLQHNNDNGFICTLCGVPHVDVTSSALEGLVNQGLETRVQELATGTYGRPVCQWCEVAPSTVQCAECMCTYCDDCTAAVHKSAAKRNHVVGHLNDAYKAFYRRCVHRGHEEYKAEFFCQSCGELCCAYCLQVGPHKDHTSVNAIQAATEARQKLSRDLQLMAHRKSALQTQASDLNRVSSLYFESYDSAENIITERFKVFRQQLMQKEVETRKALAALRESGDVSLTNARQQFLVNVNKLNEGLLRYRGLPRDGADYEVLEGREVLKSIRNIEVPSVTGTGFKMVSAGDMILSGVDIQLDLQRVEQRAEQPKNPKELLAQPVDNDRRSRRVDWVTTESPQLSSTNPLRLTFPVDEDVEATVRSDGLFLRCVARGGGSSQIGVRSRETLEAIVKTFPEDKGVVSWRVRLETISDTFIGVVQRAGRNVIPDGFYWKPACANMIDGQIGRYTAAARRLPVCSSGDVIQFFYVHQERSLRIVVNGNHDCGVIVADLVPNISACFIFYPGESLTVLL